MCAAIVVVRSHRGVKRTLSAAMSDTTDLDVSTCVYNSSNARQTKAELGRYTIATRNEFAKAEFFTVSGPDTSKIGTSLSVAAGVLGNSATKRCCIAHPQV